MAERLKAFTLDGRESVLTRTNSTPLRAGGEEGKFVVSTTRGSYIERSLFPHVVENIKVMDNVGIPVPRGILLVPDKEIMLVPDLKADMSELYGCYLLSSLIDTKGFRSRPRPEIDEIFLDMTTPKEFPKIIKSVERVFKIADKNGIEMPSDDPIELRIRPNRTRSLVCLDVFKAQTEPVQTETQRAKRIEINAESLDLVIGNLELIREKLLNP